MIDISSATVERVIVHRVGNKGRDEGFTLSQHETPKSDAISDLILENYLSVTVRRNEVLEFYHESDIALNALARFTEVIFENTDTFCTQSHNIARHLYSTSLHPNIASGELIVILFDNLRVDSRSSMAVGIFRIEIKDYYFDVLENNGTLELKDRSGIALKNIQKGALILSRPNEVFAVDTLSSKTRYWLDMFLKVRPKHTPKACAKLAGSLVKAVSNEIEDAAAALSFRHNLEAAIEEAGPDGMVLANLRSISTKYITGKRYDGILSGLQDSTDVPISDAAEMDVKSFERYSNDALKRIRLVDGVELRLSDARVHISDLVVRKHAGGSEVTFRTHTKQEKGRG